MLKAIILFSRLPRDPEIVDPETITAKNMLQQHLSENQSSLCVADVDALLKSKEDRCMSSFVLSNIGNVSGFIFINFCIAQDFTVSRITIFRNFVF